VNRSGRKVTKPREIGLEPVQREGYEYEFDVVGMLDHDHRWTLTKSCCEAYPRGAVVPQPGAEFGQRFASWLRNGGTADTRGAEPGPRAHDSYGAAAIVGD
jgi:hypothetical protein